MFIVFTFNATWYSNVKKVGEILGDESDGIYPMHCALS